MKNNELNFVFRNGDVSDAPMSNGEKQDVMINPADSVVRRVVVSYKTNGSVHGIKMFDGFGICVLDVGTFGYSDKEILLEEDERIVGVRSRLYSTSSAWHNSLVFVIGRL